jgi:hypothetical protein
MNAAPAASDSKAATCGCSQGQQKPQSQSASAANPAIAGQKGSKRQARKQH